MITGVSRQLQQLRALARLYGVQTDYYDASRRRKQASPDTLLLALRALGASVETFRDIPPALRQRRRSLWSQSVEPVQVAWEGAPLAIELRLPENPGLKRIECHLALETGESRSWSADPQNLPTVRAADVEGSRYLAKSLPLPEGLPWGYHHLTLEALGKTHHALVISAPLTAYLPSAAADQRRWGVFLPLYALRSQRSWDGGNFSDLEALVTWASDLGGRAVGTLPLMASFLNEPFDPSPYAPASRLAWNDLYIDVTKAPELQGCPEAQSFLASGETLQELEALRASPLVDYRQQMAIKRKVLEELSRCFFAQEPEQRQPFQRYLESYPQVVDYARFRATGEQQRRSWHQWPQRLRDGALAPGDYDDATMRYYLYGQWLAHQQIEALSAEARAHGSGLYLDLPLGVHSDSYDVWHERQAFALGISGGAPPDSFFTKGQKWGFPPLHPEGIREQGYRYFIASIQHHLRSADLLRIDHVMGFHRLFWVPHEVEARDGVYVRYHPEEFYAILSLESHRHRAAIVGEDLGTVPRYVRSSMGRHHVLRMYVLQFQLDRDRRRALRPVPRACVASLNTHDTPTFAGFWQGLDLHSRLDLGLLNQSEFGAEQGNRRELMRSLAGYFQDQGLLQEADAGAEAVLRAALAFLSASRARFVLVNLEDLWLETEPQNTPGTVEERPNWRRKARYSLEELSQMPQVLGILESVNSLRKRNRG